MLKASSNNIDLPGVFYVRLEPVSNIRIIKELSRLSKIGKINKTLDANTKDKKIKQNKWSKWNKYVVNLHTNFHIQLVNFSVRDGRELRQEYYQCVANSLVQPE